MCVRVCAYDLSNQGHNQEKRRNIGIGDDVAFTHLRTCTSPCTQVHKCESILRTCTRYMWKQKIYMQQVRENYVFWISETDIETTRDVAVPCATLDRAVWSARCHSAHRGGAASARTPARGYRTRRRCSDWNTHTVIGAAASAVGLRNHYGAHASVRARNLSGLLLCLCQLTLDIT